MSALATGLLAGAAVAFFVIRRRQHTAPPNQRAEHLVNTCYDLIDKIDKRLQGLGLHLAQVQSTTAAAEE